MRMYYLGLLAAVFLSLTSACQKELISTNNDSITNLQSSEIRTPEQVPLCHITGKSGYDIIYVNENAVQAHLNHGDFLLNVDNDGDGFYAQTPCTEIVDCNDADHEVTEAIVCAETDCCFCSFVEDIPWQVYLNVPEEAGFPVKGTQLIYGNPASGGFTVQIIYNGNISNGWECTFVNADFPGGSLTAITAEQAMECRNVLCKIASDLGLTNIFGIQQGESQTRSSTEFDFFKMILSK